MMICVFDEFLLLHLISGPYSYTSTDTTKYTQKPSDICWIIEKHILLKYH